MLLCNQREAAAIAGVSYAGRRPTWAELDETMQRLREAGAPLVVVTLGSDGAIAGGRGTLTLTLTLTQTLTLTPTLNLPRSLRPRPPARRSRPRPRSGLGLGSGFGL